MEALSLIDVAAEDDLLLDLASPPRRGPTPPARAGSPNVAAEASGVEAAGDSPAAGPGRVLDPCGAAEEAPEMSVSPKRWKGKAGVNLRKSLAWDSAFFTSEGVLDTEELAIVNSTFRKTQGSRLPGIMEEMRRSGESTTSTLESESWVLETVETNLFDNVRASIQRTVGKPDKFAEITAAATKKLKSTGNVPRAAARKGVGRIPQSKIRPPVSTSCSGVSGKERPQVTSKEPAASRESMLGAAEAKTTTSRPPRALPRVATMRAPTSTAVTSGFSDKRSSTGGVAHKQAVGKSANTSANLHSRSGGMAKSISTSKLGTLSSAAASPSHSVSMGTMPGVKTKSPTLSNKNRTTQRVPIRSSSRPDISKVNPTRASRNKAPKSNGDRTTPNISPTSSVDSMSSVISGVSTTSTVGKISHTSESYSTRSSSLSPSLRKSNDCPPTTKLRPTVVTERQSSGTSSGDSCEDPSNQGRGFKPSGLRRPTPKIGYFDAEKSVDQNIGAHVQVQPGKIQCSLPVTPKPQVASTEMTNPATSTFGPQDSKPIAALHPVRFHEKSVEQNVGVPQVASTEMTNPATSTFGPQDSKPIAALHPARFHEKSVEQNVGVHVQAQPGKIQCSLPVTPKPQVASSQMTNPATSTFGPQDSKPIAAAHVESIASQAKTPASKALQLFKVAQMEAEPSKVTEPEECMQHTGPVVAADTAKENIPALHKNIQTSGAASPFTVDRLTQKLSSISLGETLDLVS